MSDNMIDALAMLFTLQRWNFLPRIENWVEAENVAYVAHIVYGVGRTAGLKDLDLESVLSRTLLKSFNKCYMSDISKYTKDAIKEMDNKLWDKIERSIVQETVKLFPSKLQEFVKKHIMISTGESEQESKMNKLLQFAQMKAAITECLVNRSIYKEHPYYTTDYANIINNNKTDIDKMKDIDEYRSAYADLENFFKYILKLKYLRRWNRLNRAIETSVMSHTFLVATLVLIASKLEQLNGSMTKDNSFVLKCILRALYHDVNEGLTGDVISPVKKKIIEKGNIDWADVEAKIIEHLQNEIVPDEINNDISSLGLLEELPESKVRNPGGLVNECDKLALVLECEFEKRMGRSLKEMQNVFSEYVLELLKSPWKSISQIVGDLRLI
jgi:putative hydrolase of HD superfamily